MPTSWNPRVRNTSRARGQSAMSRRLASSMLPVHTGTPLIHSSPGIIAPRNYRHRSFRPRNHRAQKSPPELSPSGLSPSGIIPIVVEVDWPSHPKTSPAPPPSTIYGCSRTFEENSIVDTPQTCGSPRRRACNSKPSGSCCASRRATPPAIHECANAARIEITGPHPEPRYDDADRRAGAWGRLWRLPNQCHRRPASAPATDLPVPAPDRPRRPADGVRRRCPG
jgi:hypothetical protein